MATTRALARKAEPKGYLYEAIATIFVACVCRASVVILERRDETDPEWAAFPGGGRHDYSSEGGDTTNAAIEPTCFL